MKKLFFTWDERPTRLMLYVASFLWTVLLIIPGGTTPKHSYIVMFAIMNRYWWAFAFAVYWFFGAYRWLSIRWSPPWIVVLHNAFGTALWFTVSISSLLAVFPPSGVTVGNLLLACGALCLLVKTPYRWIQD